MAVTSTCAYDFVISLAGGAVKTPFLMERRTPSARPDTALTDQNTRPTPNAGSVTNVMVSSASRKVSIGLMVK
ncbi:hypothetical protein D3C79_1040580 [compost metagenome]